MHLTDSAMPGHTAYHAGQGCEQALVLISCVGVGGQGRRHGITVHRDTLVLLGRSKNSLGGFPSKGNLASSGLNSSFKLVLLIWHLC